MKEKLLWFAVVILGVMLVTSRAQSPTTQAGINAPRFQLLSLEVQTAHDKGPFVFRLDTQTGTVERYHTGDFETPGDKRAIRYSYWEKTDEKLIFHDVTEEGRLAKELGLR